MGRKMRSRSHRNSAFPNFAEEMPSSRRWLELSRNKLWTNIGFPNFRCFLWLCFWLPLLPHLLPPPLGLSSILPHYMHRKLHSKARTNSDKTWMLLRQYGTCAVSLWGRMEYARQGATAKLCSQALTEPHGCKDHSCGFLQSSGIPYSGISTSLVPSLGLPFALCSSFMYFLWQGAFLPTYSFKK